MSTQFLQNLPHMVVCRRKYYAKKSTVFYLNRSNLNIPKSPDFHSSCIYGEPKSQNNRSNDYYLSLNRHATTQGGAQCSGTRGPSQTTLTRRGGQGPGFLVLFFSGSRSLALKSSSNRHFFFNMMITLFFNPHFE